MYVPRVFLTSDVPLNYSKHRSHSADSRICKRSGFPDHYLGCRIPEPCSLLTANIIRAVLTATRGGNIAAVAVRFGPKASSGGRRYRNRSGLAIGMRRKTQCAGGKPQVIY